MLGPSCWTSLSLSSTVSQLLNSFLDRFLVDGAWVSEVMATRAVIIFVCALGITCFPFAFLSSFLFLSSNRLFLSSFLLFSSDSLFLSSSSFPALPAPPSSVFPALPAPSSSSLPPLLSPASSSLPLLPPVSILLLPPASPSAALFPPFSVLLLPPAAASALFSQSARTFSEFLHQPCDNITVTFPMADGVTRELVHVMLSHG